MLVFSAWSSDITKPIVARITSGGTAANKSMMLWRFFMKTQLVEHEKYRKMTSSVKITSKEVSRIAEVRPGMGGSSMVWTAVTAMVAMMKGSQVLWNQSEAQLESGSSKNRQIFCPTSLSLPLLSIRGRKICERLCVLPFRLKEFLTLLHDPSTVERPEFSVFERLSMNGAPTGSSLTTGNSGPLGGRGGWLCSVENSWSDDGTSFSSSLFCSLRHMGVRTSSLGRTPEKSPTTSRPESPDLEREEVHLGPVEGLASSTSPRRFRALVTLRLLEPRET
mmetsp:Transcript_35779/g.99163  ORF Transcript_35779/g.99163 Transcript_35779/m.99163 type:complete len:278 (-) Transcript_35779:430-1263(-)